MSKNHLVIGGGITGLVTALLVQQARPGQTVYVIEQERQLGGLLRSFDYGEQGRFDYGTHILAETGIAALDDLLMGLLPDDEWQWLTGNQRDLAGIFLWERLQTNSVYIDLRNLPARDFDRCLAGFFRNLGEVAPDANANAYTYTQARFGAAIVEAAIRPVVKKLFKREPEAIDPMATQLAPMDRVVLFDEALFSELMAANILRQRLAFPEQRLLAPHYASGKRSYYPKHFGMYRVIEALRQRLEDQGVNVLTATKLTQLAHTDGRITTATVQQGGVSTTIEQIDNVYWTVGLPALANILDLSFKDLAYDPPLKTVLVHFLLDRPLTASDLYYFYCYDAGYTTYRVTNYSAYCPGAVRNGGYPVTLELFVEQVTPALVAELGQIAWRELTSFGVVPLGTKILWHSVEPLTTGFPMPSLVNFTAMDTLRQRIEDLRLENLVNLGILAKPRLFFQTAVLINAYEQVTGRL